jgi:endoplasmic reticulum-Golgi intermediate compartment protein 3
MSTNSNAYDATFSYSGGYSETGSNDYYANSSSSSSSNNNNNTNNNTATTTGGGAPIGSSSPTQQQASLRRRAAEGSYATTASSSSNSSGNFNDSFHSPFNGTLPTPTHYAQQRTSPKRTTNVVKKLDFMFPKVDVEYTVQTERGGITTLITYGIIAILVGAECLSWISQNYHHSSVEHIKVDTSLGKKMQVNIDITFPSLACEDLHIDIMDVAGDSQLGIEDQMVKKRLNMKGLVLGKEETVEANKHQQIHQEKQLVLKVELPDNYCGPCYGAHQNETQCCNTCDELMEAYKTKRWRTDLLLQSAEQCIREGRDKIEPKHLRRGEGCNLQGHFMVNRVGGNFHIAMGEGIERDGRHIHTFNPEETHHFNASHVIHHLSFGPEPEYSYKNHEVMALNGAKKIVSKEHGTTGLFQYFIKIVPTTYIGSGNTGSKTIETNRYFYTERFRPLMKEIFESDETDDDDSEKNVESPIVEKDADGKKTSVHAGHVGGHAHQDHHNVKKNALLPGVFFIYEIYPFEVEISSSSVPITHLLVRLMATIGGVYTIMRWMDSFLYARERRR